MVSKLLCNILLMLGMITLSTQAMANNLQLTNLNVVSTDTASNTMTFTFDLSQDNSWKTTINNDAVWV